MLLSPNEIRVDYHQKFVRPLFDPDGRDTELVGDIRKYGILEPLLVTHEKHLLNGWRRLSVAKLLRLPQVECTVRTCIPTDALFLSMLMGRSPSVYTTCQTRAEHIETLLCQGENLETAEVTTEEQRIRHEQAWIKLELATGIPRDTLIAGWRLLRDMAKLEAGEKAEAREYGRRVVSTFRNKGLAPALRMAELPRPVLTIELDEGTFEQDP